MSAPDSFHRKESTAPPSVRLLTGKSLTPSPFSRALLVSSGAHVLAGLMLAVAPLLHLNWPAPREHALEFALVSAPAATSPKEAHFLGEKNQQAGARQTPTRKPRPAEQAADATSPLPPRPTPSPPEAPRAQIPPPSPQPAPDTSAQTPRTPPSTLAQAEKSSDSPPVEGPVLMTSLTDPALNAVDASVLPSNAADASLESLASASQTLSPEAGPATEDAVAIKASDFGPWMNGFKRRLSRNWAPPRGERRRKVTLLIDVLRDGAIKGITVEQSSGEKRSDEAAMDAVRVSAPFEPLPAAYAGESVPILFTFDYTVFGDSRRP